MAYKITENELLRQIFDLIVKSEIFPEIMPLEWISRLLYMHKRRWLYCSVKGSQLVAIMGAFRIKEWDDKYFTQLPEKEEGDILFIPFVAASEKVRVAPLRLIRYCLKENPHIKEIIYYKKNFNFNKRRLMLRRLGKQGIEVTQLAARA